METIITIIVEREVLDQMNGLALPYIIKNVEEKYTYTHNKEWKQLKKKANAAYKELKAKEFDIRWEEKK